MTELIKAPEFKRLPPELAEEVLRRTLDCLQRAYGQDLVSVVFYGSFARGDHKELSDFDLLIVCDRLPDSRLERSRALNQALDEVTQWKRANGFYSQGLWVEVMPILKSREEAAYHSPLYLDMTEDARILYDKGGPSFYGDEARNIAPGQLYGEPEARRALEQDRRPVHELCAQLIASVPPCV